MNHMMELLRQLPTFSRSKTKEERILILGSNASGKTTLLYRLKLDECVVAIPTVGFNIETVTYKRKKLTFWDVGGSNKLNPLWHDSLSRDASCLYVHDVGQRTEESVEDVRAAAHVIKTADARFVWVLFNKQDLLSDCEAQAIRDNHRRMLETELSAHAPNVQWQLVDLPGFSAMTGDRCSELLEIIYETIVQRAKLNDTSVTCSTSSQPTKPAKPANIPPVKELLARIEREREDSITGDEFWNSFASGELVDWNHRRYLRAGYCLLLDALRDGKSILSCAEEFLGHLRRLASIHPERFRNTEHRTLSVFWLYNLQIAIMSCQSSRGMNKWPDRDMFDDVLFRSPNLICEDLWMDWYTLDLMMSPDAKLYWRLPDLKVLPSIIVSNEEQWRLGRRLTRKQPDRSLSFAFAVVQTYMSSDVRRDWLVKQSMAILQTTTMRCRAQNSSLLPYSATRAYFWIQIVHAALSTIRESFPRGPTTSTALSRLSFSNFQKHFNLDPELWRVHYTPTRWESVEARGAFVLPDLQPLPNVLTRTASTEVTSALMWESDSSDISMTAEIPSMEVLCMHVAILLEKSASLGKQEAESPIVVSHAQLLRFLFERLQTAEGHGIETLTSRAATAMMDIQGPYVHGLTLKAFWTRKVLAAIRTADERTSFEDLIRANMHLAYANLPLVYFSPTLLRSLGAEEKIVSSDRKKLDGFATVFDEKMADEEKIGMPDRKKLDVLATVSDEQTANEEWIVV